MLKISEKYTKKYTRIIRSRRQATIDKAVKEFERTGNEKVLDEIKEPYLKPLLKQLYLSVAAEIGTLQLSSFGQKASIEKQSWYKKVIAYIDAEVGEKVTTISETFKDDADKVITTLTKAYASVNEVRAAAGLQPIKGKEYDKPLMPMNVTTELDAELNANEPI